MDHFLRFKLFNTTKICLPCPDRASPNRNNNTGFPALTMSTMLFPTIKRFKFLTLPARSKSFLNALSNTKYIRAIHLASLPDV